MTAHDEFKCPRCGTPLPTETVRYPVKKWVTNEVTGKVEEVFDHYDERREPKDCPRCQGSY